MGTTGRDIKWRTPLNMDTLQGLWLGWIITGYPLDYFSLSFPGIVHFYGGRDRNSVDDSYE